jgi:hypothetical protein
MGGDAMKRFYYTRDIIEAAGYQRYYVEAETLEEAQKLAETDSLFDAEEIVVTIVGDIEWEEIPK